MIAPARTTWRAGGPRPETRPTIGYRIASTLAERRQAFHLVYQNYVTKGLIEPSSCRMRVTPWHLQPTTSTFIAVERGRVRGTVTLIGDGALGLPMESIYPAEVERARMLGLYVGEVSCLAADSAEFREFLPIFVSLTRLMAQHARAHGMDQFLITIHPKHSRFYERFMGFEQIGDLTEYPSVNNAPAVACCLDFHRIDRHKPACWERFFGTPIPRVDLEPSPLSEEELDYFGPIADRAEQQLLVCA